MKKALKQRLKNVKLLILDVDGVLTNGDIILDHQGKEIKIFNVQDGFALVFFLRLGFNVALISARSSKAVTGRAKDIGIQHVYQDARPKIDAYRKLLSELKLNDHDTCYVGDDLPDIQVLQKAGMAVAVANAVKEVKAIAHYVTRSEGGRGAVREIVELILKSQERWDDVVEKFKD